jgi:L-lactate permease
MTDLAMWALVVGFLLPPALSVLLQTKWPDSVKSVVAFLVSLLAGAGTAYFSADLTGRSWVSASLVVFVTAVATYKNFWKQTGVSPAIESKTNLG